MYDELRSPFSIRWAREAGFGAKSLMRVRRAGLMVGGHGKLRLLDASPELVATTAIGPPVALGERSAALWYGWPLLASPSSITSTDLLLHPERVIAEVRTALRLPLAKINAPLIMEIA